jgi:hypothetical protein
MLGIVAGGMLAWAMRRNPHTKKKKKSYSEGWWQIQIQTLVLNKKRMLLQLHLEHTERLVSEDPEKFLSLKAVLENQYLFQFHAQYETVVNEDFHQMVTEKKLSLQKSYLGCALSV